MSNTFLTAELTDWLPRCVLRPGKLSPVDPRCRRRSIPPGPSSPSSPEPEWPQDTGAFATKSLQFPIDAQQTEILACPPERSRRTIVCCSRQWGKSTTGAIKVLHHALQNPGSLTLIASKTLRQAGELLEKVANFAQTIAIPIRRAPRYTDSLLLPNQSRIIALPGKPDSLRGFSAVSLLIVDEAAYVRDELYHALRPMLATTNGSIWLLSTPNGRSGFFYDEWSSTDTTWTKFSVKAGECPRISPAFLAEERKLHGPALFHREYECDFGYTGKSFFNLDDLDSAAGPERFHAAEEFAMGRPTTRFYVGFDLGQKDSYSAVVVIELIRGATERHNPVTWDRIVEIITRPHSRSDAECVGSGAKLWRGRIGAPSHVPSRPDHGAERCFAARSSAKRAFTPLSQPHLPGETYGPPMVVFWFKVYAAFLCFIYSFGNFDKG